VRVRFAGCHGRTIPVTAGLASVARLRTGSDAAPAQRSKGQHPLIF
jgi:hypothetical protein